MRYSKAVFAAVAVMGCSPEGRGEPAGAAELGPPEPVGAASGAVTGAYCILDARTDEGSFHFEGPRWLLGSGEGKGPMIIEVRLQSFVLPAMSTTTTHKPDPSVVSAAVGYNMTEWYGLFEFTRVDIEARRFQRVEAYPAFQRTVWEIRDADCNVFLGMGASYKPIGVYFKVVNSVDVALPDVGVRVLE